jgi:hypothetical protein
LQTQALTELMDPNRLRELAAAFRAAIERFDRRSLPIGFDEFPRGSCGETTLLLGAYLKDQGMGSFDYVKGERGEYGVDWHTHAWLEKDAVIVDINADQFAPEVTEPVIVIKASQSAWHQSFERESREDADFRTDGGRERAGHRLSPHYTGHPVSSLSLSKTPFQNKGEPSRLFCLNPPGNRGHLTPILATDKVPLSVVRRRTGEGRRISRHDTRFSPGSSLCNQLSFRSGFAIRR